MQNVRISAFRRSAMIVFTAATLLVTMVPPSVAGPTPGDGVTSVELGSTWDGSLGAELRELDAGGHQIAVFDHDGTFRYHRRGGRWSARYPLAEDVHNSQVGVAAGKAGTAVVAWTRGDWNTPESVVVRMRRTDASWTQPYAVGTTAASVRPSVSGNADGDYAVVWARRSTNPSDRRPRAFVSIRLRGDRWRSYAVGPMMAKGALVGRMDAAGRVYVARDYAAANTPEESPSAVLRIKRPTASMSATEVITDAPFTSASHRSWHIEVEPTGRQTRTVTTGITSTGGLARVLRQETLGGPVVEVARRDDALVAVAVGGARLRVVWDHPSGTSTPGRASTQVLRPTVGAEQDVAPGTDVAMDKYGRGLLTWFEGTPPVSYPAEGEDTRAMARPFTDAGLGAEFLLAQDGPAATMVSDWIGYTATDGHVLNLGVNTDMYDPEPPGGPPYEWKNYALTALR